MKALLVLTDSEAVHALERALLESGDRGFTVFPGVVGRGRTGLKAGDRVHPGASSLLLTVVPDGEVDATLRTLREARDQAGARAATRMYLMPVEEVD